jgi:hypothetical protein
MSRAPNGFGFPYSQSAHCEPVGELAGIGFPHFEHLDFGFVCLRFILLCGSGLVRLPLACDAEGDEEAFDLFFFLDGFDLEGAWIERDKFFAFRVVGDEQVHVVNVEAIALTDGPTLFDCRFAGCGHRRTALLKEASQVSRSPLRYLTTLEDSFR